MVDILFSHMGRGKEIADFLRAELGLPERVISFEVRFAPRDAITVTCTYCPAALPDEPLPDEEPEFIPAGDLDDPDAVLPATHGSTLDG